MTKKILILSIILFVVAVALPFRNIDNISLNPLASGFIRKNNSASNFEKSALNPAYIKDTKIEYQKADTLNKDAPEINAKSAIVIDTDSHKILYAKNEEEKLPMASLTKVMTAIMAVEHMDTKKLITVSKNAATTGENTMGLLENEKFTLEELLYGLILNSANDSAVAIAEGVAGTEQEFVDFMNKKANLLGAKNTLFVDPNGLNKYNKVYYSTSLDLAKIAAYSLNYSLLKDIYQTLNKELPSSNLHGQKILENQTNLLSTYPGVKGMKTGYTEDAGLCLISLAENDGKRIIVVILGSTDRRGDGILLLDFGFNQLGVKVEHNLLDE